MLRKRRRSLMIAMGYGDAFIGKNRSGGNSYRISITHCAKQEQYIRYKASLINEMFDGKSMVRSINNHGFPGFTFERGSKHLRLYREKMYRNNEKFYNRKMLNYLTDEGLAIWYMDDGSLSPKKNNGKITAYELTLSTYTTKEQNNVLIDYFNQVWGVKFSQRYNKGSYTLRCGTIEARKFIAIVKPYILPLFSYKIAISQRPNQGEIQGKI